MRLTVALYNAVTDIAHYGRSILKDVAAARIAEAFGFTLEQLSIAPFLYEEGVTDGRGVVHTAGHGVNTSTLAWQIANKLSPGWDANVGAAPFIGSGKNADWLTGQALDAIRDAINFPHMYVREVKGPDKPAPKRPGETGNWTILGSGDVLGYELYRYFDADSSRQVLGHFDSEDAAVEELVRLANERPDSFSYGTE